MIYPRSDHGPLIPLGMYSDKLSPADKNVLNKICHEEFKMNNFYPFNSKNKTPLLATSNTWVLLKPVLFGAGEDMKFRTPR